MVLVVFDWSHMERVLDSTIIPMEEIQVNLKPHNTLDLGSCTWCTV